MAHAGVPVSHGAEHGVGHVAVVEGGGVALGGGEHRHRQVGQVLVEADTWDSVLTCDTIALCLLELQRIYHNHREGSY